jgi:transcriptional regulator with XRE-family HTH domain
MLIDDRLQALRKERNLSPGDIEKRTGLIRTHLSQRKLSQPKVWVR